MIDVLTGMVIALVVISLGAAVLRLALKVFWKVVVLVSGYASRYIHRNDTSIEQGWREVRQPMSPPAFDPRFAREAVGQVNAISSTATVSLKTAILTQPHVSATRPTKATVELAGPAEISDDVLWRRFTMAVDPIRFEKLVLEAYFREGFHTKPTKVVNDDGLDGVLFRDSTAIGVQVKRWNRSKVSGPEIIHFVGTLNLHDLEEGHFLTTGKVTASARRLAERSQTRCPRIKVIKGEELMAFMLKYLRAQIVEIAASAQSARNPF